VQQRLNGVLIALCEQQLGNELKYARCTERVESKKMLLTAGCSFSCNHENHHRSCKTAKNNYLSEKWGTRAEKESQDLQFHAVILLKRYIKVNFFMKVHFSNSWDFSNPDILFNIFYCRYYTTANDSIFFGRSQLNLMSVNIWKLRLANDHCW